MKVFYNKIIPFRGFRAINLFGVLFVRKGCEFSERVFNHEKIHTAQMKEMLYIGFYIWYAFEWVVKLFGRCNAYRNISFEKEAYDNEENFSYLNDRRRFAWFRYLKHCY